MGCLPPINWWFRFFPSTVCSRFFAGILWHTQAIFEECWIHWIHEFCATRMRLSQGCDMILPGLCWLYQKSFPVGAFQKRWFNDNGLVGGLAHELFEFPFSWEFHHPNWRTHMFQRGWNHQLVDRVMNDGSNRRVVVGNWFLVHARGSKVSSKNQQLCLWWLDFFENYIATGVSAYIFMICVQTSTEMRICHYMRGRTDFWERNPYRETWGSSHLASDENKPTDLKFQNSWGYPITFITGL